MKHIARFYCPKCVHNLYTKTFGGWVRLGIHHGINWRAQAASITIQEMTSTGGDDVMCGSRTLKLIPNKQIVLLLIIIICGWWGTCSGWWWQRNVITRSVDGIHLSHAVLWDRSCVKMLCRCGDGDAGDFFIHREPNDYDDIRRDLHTSVWNW